MNFPGFLPKRAVSTAVVVLSAAGLSGCFDLEQRVGVHSNGSGSYAVVVTAEGIVADGLEKKPADIDVGDNRAVHTVVRHGDRATETSEVAFHDLSDLKLDDETLSLHVKGKKLFGLGGTEVNFHRSFHVDHARSHHEDAEDKDLGHDILQSMFGDHTYTFVVWLPGEIEHVAPLRVGDQVVQPGVLSDRYGHTVVWKMKLTDMFLADQLDFDVDFAARGDFHDTQSQAGHHRHHHDET
jgi:hypothetical protein